MLPAIAGQLWIYRQHRVDVEASVGRLILLERVQDSSPVDRLVAGRSQTVDFEMTGGRRLAFGLSFAIERGRGRLLGDDLLLGFGGLLPEMFRLLQGSL
jgi:hypothetical protein